MINYKIYVETRGNEDFSQVYTSEKSMIELSYKILTPFLREVKLNNNQDNNDSQNINNNLTDNLFNKSFIFQLKYFIKNLHNKFFYIIFDIQL